MRTLILFYLQILFISTVFAQNESYIAKDVKYVYAEEFGEFDSGLAVIKNNLSSAIINAKGELVFPFNKYTIDIKSNQGIFIVSDSKKFGYMNTQFKLITPLIYQYDLRFKRDKHAINQIANQSGWFQSISSTGAVYPMNKYIKGQLADYSSELPLWGPAFSDGLVAFSIMTDKINKSFGFISRTGAIVIPNIYERAGAFRDGLAPVLKSFGDGSRKWGIIDKNGKTVIPFSYSNPPDGFSGGLCLVKTLPGSEFDYAYIDKANQLVLKLTKDKIGSAVPRELFAHRIRGINKYDGGSDEYYDIYGHMKSPFQGKYAIWTGPILVSREGNVKKIDEMLKAHNIVPDFDGVALHHVIRNEQVIFQNKKKLGMLSTDGSLTLPPIFSYLTHFDNISKLAYAKLELNEKILEGYINTSGKFVILKGIQSGM